jgi:hypothetical protein
MVCLHIFSLTFGDDLGQFAVFAVRVDFSEWSFEGNGRIGDKLWRHLRIKSRSQHEVDRRSSQKPRLTILFLRSLTTLRSANF